MTPVKAIRMHTNGEPGRARLRGSRAAPAGAGEVRVRHTAIALNFSDINVRRGGFYIADPLAFPLILGNEGSRRGRGDRRRRQQRGPRRPRRLCRLGRSVLREHRLLCASPQHQGLVPDPACPPISPTRQAAAFMLKGLTASLVINRHFKPKPGDWVLDPRCGERRRLDPRRNGASISAPPSSALSAPPRRRRWQRPTAADHTILYRETDFVAAVTHAAARGVERRARRRRPRRVPGLARLHGPVRPSRELRQCFRPSRRRSTCCCSPRRAR